MTFSTVDAVILTAAFFIPGFIWSTALSMLIPRRAEPAQIRFLEFLTLSCVNYAIWVWPLVLMLGSEFTVHHPIATYCLLLAAMGISPGLLGLLTGRLYQTDWPSMTALDLLKKRRGVCRCIS